MSISGSAPATLVWFRHDLRLADNPALAAAVKRGGPVIPVFIWAPKEEGAWPPGGASRWWLHQSLMALEADLHAVGSRLVLCHGQPTLETLQQLLAKTKATTIFWNRRYEPAICQRDARLQESLRATGIEAESFNAALLHEPWTIQSKAGKPFQVFTPFWRHCLSLPEPPEPLAAPQRLLAPARWPASAKLEDLTLKPIPDWAEGLRAAWQPGTTGATAQLNRFLADAYADYDQNRNRPDLPGTSRLSPHLHFGEISPRQIWHAMAKVEQAFPSPPKRSAPPHASPVLRSRATAEGGRITHHSQFLTELGWREFSHHLLFHFPHTDTQPLRPEFAPFRWRTDGALLKAWQQGRTGYPFVDAGLRELWTTGWMHNRVRMVVASFLVKDLLISWTEGARWFWDTLVDADLAQNTLGWQWTAGCGADAAPFFRVFNPNGQGETFDPEGAYIRRWVPELAKLPDKWIHRPHTAAPEALSRAGVELDKTYPAPIINHTIAREVALEAYARLKE